MLTAARPGCVHICGTASGVSSPQASDVGVPCCQGTQYWWFPLIQDLDTSLVVFLRGTCSGLGLPEGGILYGFLSKEALYIGKASVNRTHSPGLAARLTEHFWCLCRPGLKDASKPRKRLLSRKLWSVRSHWQSFLPSLKLQPLKHWQYRWRFRWATRGMLRRKDASGAKENAKVWALGRTPSSWRRRKRRPWESIWGCSATQEALANRSQSKPVQFPGALGLGKPFSPLCAGQIQEEHAYYAFKGTLYLLDPCRLGAFPGVLYKRFEQIELPVNPATKVPRWEIASYLCGACKHVSELLKLPSRQCSASRVLDYLLRFIRKHPKKFQFFRFLQLSRIFGMSTESSTMLLVACVVGQRAGGIRRSWQFAKRAARGGPFGTFNPRTSGTGRLSNLPMRWSCAACGPRRESGDCPCADRRKISILDVSHFLGRVGSASRGCRAGW